MKASLKWLNEYVKCNDISKEDLENTLTLTGTKVETVDMLYDVTGVVIGKIVKITEHPDADSLVVCDVDIKNSHVQIVTAAKNVFEGAIVPVSLDGAILAGGIKIKTSKLRGIESQGMMCSTEELGLPSNFLGQEKQEGILILSEELEKHLGEDIYEALDLNDVVFDFEITPNRQDCQGVMGIARELSVGLDREFNENLETKFDEFEKVDNLEGLKVRVETEKCNRYMLYRVDNVKIEKSPEEIARKLAVYDMTAKNNIVDITNYVLLELGQPVHAFDLDKIEGDICIRDAKDGEVLELLDDTEVELKAGDVVIADSKKVLALAGIMGGKYSGITEDTKNVVFEIANFERKPLRDTARRLQISSDSLARFEKKLPMSFTEYALCRIYELLKEENVQGNIQENTSDNTPKKEVIDIVTGEKEENNWVKLDDERICKRLGIDISKDFMLDIFKKLDFDISEDKEMVRAPKYRTDIERVEDLSEEVIRFYGYDKLNATLPNIYIKNKDEEKERNIVEDIKNILVDQGYNQIIKYGFISKEELDKLESKDDKITNPIEVINSLGVDYEIMRTTLVPSMLTTISLNEARKNMNLRLFEIGKRYVGKENIQKGILPTEEKFLTMAYTSKTKNNMTEEGSQMGYIYNPIYVFKSNILKMLKRIGIRNYNIVPEKTNEIYHLGQCANIQVGKDIIGTFGMISPKIAKNYDIKEDVYMLELNLEKAKKYASKKQKLVETSKYPEVTRELSIVVADNIEYKDIEEEIRKAGKKISSIQLFDIYKAEYIEGKSITVSIVFRDNKKTLEEEEVTKEMENILKALEDNLNASLRK